MTLIERAAADLGLVAEYWPALAELRDPSVYAPRPASLLTPDKRAENDHQARLERRERDGLMPGEHQDAARPEVLDLMAGLAYDAWDVADTILQALDGPPLARPSTTFSDPAPYLETAIRHLQAAHAADDMVGPWVAGQARLMVADISRALCLSHDGQTLKARCPWCKGGLAGDSTLRVRILPGQEVAIVCESDIACEPPRRKVGTWLHSRPCWPFRDWPWLAKELHAADGREMMSA